jgi:hypothetical protein
MTLTMKKQTFLKIFSPLLLLGFALNSYAVVTLSTGHVDGFEIHYDPTATDPEERFGLHIHDESTNTHYEPAEVILQVNEAAYGLQGEVFASAADWAGRANLDGFCPQLKARLSMGAESLRCCSLESPRTVVGLLGPGISLKSL